VCVYIILKLFFFIINEEVVNLITSIETSDWQ
jgi:hypothetical protein